MIDTDYYRVFAKNRGDNGWRYVVAGTKYRCQEYISGIGGFSKYTHWNIMRGTPIEVVAKTPKLGEDVWQI